MGEDLIVTQEGLDKMKTELAERLLRRRKIANKIEYAKNLGDLSENFEYQEAKEDQSHNETRLLELEDSIRRSIVQAKADTVSNGISLGCKIKAVVGGVEKDFQIVSFNEAEPAKGKISNESPLGSGFLGKKSGDKVVIETPRGKIEYEIKEFS